MQLAGAAQHHAAAGGEAYQPYGSFRIVADLDGGAFLFGECRAYTVELGVSCGAQTVAPIETN